MIAVIYGEDDSRMEYKLNQLKKSVDPEILIRLDANTDSSDSFFEEISTPSLFAEKKMVVLDNANFLASGKARKTKTPEDDEGEEAAPEAVSADYPADLILNYDLEDGAIVYLVHKKSLDSRTKLVKALTKKAKVIECKPMDEKSLPAMVNDLLKEKGLRLDPDAKNWYISHAGLSSSKIDTELDKFRLYGEHLNLEDVKALTAISPQENVFKMTDALFARQGTRLLAYYRNFRNSGMEPIAIAALLASQIRFVYQVRVMMDMNLSDDEMARQLGASRGRIFMTKKNASRFQAFELLQHLALLADLDQKMKSGQVDKDEGFEQFIFDLILEENKAGWAS